MSEVRLIDANALTKIIERELYYAENTTIHKTLNYCLGAIQNAPTVGDRYSEGYSEGYSDGYLDGMSGADMRI